MSERKGGERRRGFRGIGALILGLALSGAANAASEPATRTATEAPSAQAGASSAQTSASPAQTGASPAPAAGAQAPTTALASPADAAQTASTLLWYPAPARCAFFTPEDWARFRPGDPATWRFRFLVLAGPKPSESAERPERGYVMKDGLVRELEKVRSGPDAEGASVTVWRSAGEPRLNITTTLRPAPDDKAEPAGRQRLGGTLATVRGEGRDVTDIVGTCED
ncbi:hypothetical protein [Aureimonas ureilytica]|uniref:hypothetical protein n=1 Tax=Aureimonas ureilytica TaxID=401562 RepID=UPI00037F2D20|nr:hypothetical protein [Aureimonas ureilytica]